MSDRYRSAVEALLAGSSIVSGSTRDISPHVIDEQGGFRILPAAAWRDFTPGERAFFAHRRAMYILPTVELVDRLRFLIGGRNAIEIGSGNGILAGALGIPATDSHQQEDPRYRAIYELSGQPVITYGKQVERLDAAAAIAKHRPSVVVAAWVTHRFQHTRPDAGGNEAGVDEDALINAVDEYIFVGNRQTHAGKAIWSRPCTVEHHDFIMSRAINGTPDFIARWRR